MMGEHEICAVQLPLPGTLTIPRVIDVIYGIWGGMVREDSEDERFQKIEAVLFDQTWAVETMAKTFYPNMTSISYYWLEGTMVRACSLPMLVRERSYV
jgi:hypothetical protein